MIGLPRINVIIIYPKESQTHTSVRETVHELVS